MCIAALFTIAMRWKQHTGPSTDKGINKMWYIHNEILFSLKNEGNSHTGYNIKINVADINAE